VLVAAVLVLRIGQGGRDVALMARLVRALVSPEMVEVTLRVRLVL
jgi:hypothetical protein